MALFQGRTCQNLDSLLDFSWLSCGDLPDRSDASSAGVVAVYQNGLRLKSFQRIPLIIKLMRIALQLSTNESSSHFLALAESARRILTERAAIVTVR
jgi:hypothetical protein